MYQSWHVTKNVLCRHVEATDAANGFLNRFLWVCVDSKDYAHGDGKIGRVDLVTPAIRPEIDAASL
jgi:hypothetical protein